MTASRGRDGRGSTRRSGGRRPDEAEYAATAGARTGEQDRGHHDEPDDRDEDYAYDGETYDEYDDEAYEDGGAGERHENAAQGEGRDDERRAPRRRMSATHAAQAALGHITGMTGKSAEGITSVRPEDDGWTVGVELLDARHIPSSSDTLALYEVEIDADGELTSYHRVARYSRARGSSEAS